MNTSFNAPEPHAGKSTISVALCTYNGERFLPDQLNSIRRQSRLPDQVILSDDHSTDGTLKLLHDFARAAPFPVEILTNSANIGSLRNFEQALRACKGSLIALSDQDDIWHPDRLVRSEEELLAHPEVGLVFTNGEVVDDQNRKIGVRLWENFGFEGARKEALRSGNYIPMARLRFVTGATVMFRTRFLPYCFPVGEGWVHDGWIAAIIASMAFIRAIDEPLVAYRRHASQQIGLGPARSVDTEKASLELMAKRHWSSFTDIRKDLAEICAALDDLPISPAQQQLGAASAFRQHYDFLTMRIALPESRLARLPIMLRNLDSYSACAMSWLSVAKDFILPKPPGIHLWRHAASATPPA